MYSDIKRSSFKNAAMFNISLVYGFFSRTTFDQIQNQNKQKHVGTFAFVSFDRIYSIVIHCLQIIIIQFRDKNKNHYIDILSYFFFLVWRFHFCFACTLIYSLRIQSKTGRHVSSYFLFFVFDWFSCCIHSRMYLCIDMM